MSARNRLLVFSSSFSSSAGVLMPVSAAFGASSSACQVVSVAFQIDLGSAIEMRSSESDGIIRSCFLNSLGP